MRHKLYRRASLVIFLIGVIFTVFFGLYGFSYLEVYNNRKRVYGTISKIDLSNKSTYVRYTAEEKSLEVRFNLIDSEFKEGNKVIVYYNDKNPENAFLKEEVVSVFYFFIIGICLIVIGIILYFKEIIKIEINRKLMKNGKKIKAKITKIERNELVSFLLTKPYILVCEIEENNKRYKFINPEIWFDIESTIKKKNKKTIDVYVNPKNYKKYYIDLNSLK